MAFVGLGLRRRLLSDFTSTERCNSFNISHPELICEESLIDQTFSVDEEAAHLWLQVGLEQLHQACHGNRGTCMTYLRLLLSAETSLDVTAVI